MGSVVGRKAGLPNPLKAAQYCCGLEDGLREMGYTVHVYHDMSELDTVKRRVRGSGVAPMHHHETAVFGNERAFWMSVTETATNQIVGLQAYRYDEVDTHLADWCMNYMIGVYMRRNELMVPSHSHPPVGSIAERLTGKLVYHGECWVDKAVRNRMVLENFVRLGSMLSYIKWQPDAVWALVSSQVAKHGHHVRAGYTIVERGFLRWTWASEGIDPVEYLIAIERQSLEALVEEGLAKTDEYRPALLPS